MATSSTFLVFEAMTSPLLVPLIVSIVAVAWVVGIAIKAMKSKDLV